MCSKTLLGLFFLSFSTTPWGKFDNHSIAGGKRLRVSKKKSKRSKSGQNPNNHMLHKLIKSYEEKYPRSQMPLKVSKKPLDLSYLLSF